MHRSPYDRWKRRSGRNSITHVTDRIERDGRCFHARSTSKDVFERQERMTVEGYRDENRIFDAKVRTRTCGKGSSTYEQRELSFSHPILRSLPPNLDLMKNPPRSGPSDPFVRISRSKPKVQTTDTKKKRGVTQGWMISPLV